MNDEDFIAAQAEAARRLVDPDGDPDALDPGDGEYEPAADVDPPEADQVNPDADDDLSDVPEGEDDGTQDFGDLDDPEDDESDGDAA